jgi:hypothetical protein
LLVEPIMSSGKAKRNRRTERSKRRERFFDLYAANWGIYYGSRYPDFAGKVFTCPICLRAFDRDAIAANEIDIAHVYPQAAGGKLETMTCKDCNSRIGAKYDSHIAEAHKINAIMSGQSDAKMRAQMELNGINVAAELSHTGTNFNFTHIPEDSNPEQSKQFADALKAGALNHGTVKLKLPRFKPAHYNIGILHSAYLAAFRMFGYEWIGAADTERFREVLMADKIPEGWGYAAMNLPATVEFPHEAFFSVGFAWIGRTRRCVSVIFPQQHGRSATAIMLPGFGEDGRMEYEAQLASAKMSEEVSIEIAPMKYKPEERLGNPRFRFQGSKLWETFTPHLLESSSQ